MLSCRIVEYVFALTLAGSHRGGSEYPDRVAWRRLSHVQHHPLDRLQLRLQSPARLLRRHGGPVPGLPPLRPVWQYDLLPLREHDHLQPDHPRLRLVVQCGMQPVISSDYVSPLWAINVASWKFKFKIVHISHKQKLTVHYSTYPHRNIKTSRT